MNYIKNNEREFENITDYDTNIWILCEYDDCSDYPYSDFEDLLYELENNNFISFSVQYLEWGYSDSEEQVYIHINDLKIILNTWFINPNTLEQLIDYVIENEKKAKNIRRKLEKVL